METIAVRLHPGQDLLLEMERLVKLRGVEAAIVLTCVGSLTLARLRFANCEQPAVLKGHFEIVSLEGVLSCHGSHCHIAISDSDGRMVGAHLLDGCQIYTTAEIVIGLVEGKRFTRSFDDTTGYPELEITSITTKGEE